MEKGDEKKTTTPSLMSESLESEDQKGWPPAIAYLDESIPTDCLECLSYRNSAARMKSAKVPQIALDKFLQAARLHSQMHEEQTAFMTGLNRSLRDASVNRLKWDLEVERMRSPSLMAWWIRERNLDVAFTEQISRILGGNCNKDGHQSEEKHFN
ncbi:hypothetical protein OSTOST_13469 [Ostertagia ostertagi]